MIINIKSDETRFLSEIKNHSDALSCRVYSLYLSYGCKYSFADFWYQTNENDDVTAFISRYYQAYTVSLLNNADLSEISVFLNIMSDAVSVLYNGDNNLDLCCKTFDVGYIMEYVGVTDYKSQKIITPNIKNSYRLLKECKSDSFLVPDYDSFCIDVSHRIRHNTGRIYGIERNTGLVSFAMTTAECDKCAVLGAVCTHPDFRKNGYGKILVKHFSNELKAEEKSVFILRNESLNELFYLNCGYQNCGKWTECYFI